MRSCILLRGAPADVNGRFGCKLVCRRSRQGADARDSLVKPYRGSNMQYFAHFSGISESRDGAVGAVVIEFMDDHLGIGVEIHQNAYREVRPEHV